MATQTRALMAKLDSATYATQIAEEAFVDAVPRADPPPRARRAATVG
jgi:hypothetical protein